MFAILSYLFPSYEIKKLNGILFKYSYNTVYNRMKSIVYGLIDSNMTVRDIKIYIFKIALLSCVNLNSLATAEAADTFSYDDVQNCGLLSDAPEIPENLKSYLNKGNKVALTDLHGIALLNQVQNNTAADLKFKIDMKYISDLNIEFTCDSVCRVSFDYMGKRLYATQLMKLTAICQRSFTVCSYYVTTGSCNDFSYTIITELIDNNERIKIIKRFVLESSELDLRDSTHDDALFSRPYGSISSGPPVDIRQKYYFKEDKNEVLSIEY